MRQKLEEFAASKAMLAFNFAASAGDKLVSINGYITEVGDNFIIIKDIYHNTMFVPVTSLAYIEIKK